MSEEKAQKLSDRGVKCPHCLALIGPEEWVIRYIKSLEDTIGRICEKINKESHEDGIYDFPAVKIRSRRKYEAQKN